MKATLLAALLTSTLAFAADLKPGQEEAKAAFDKQWKSLLADINTACGTKLDAVKTDFESYEKKNFTRATPGTVCSTLSYAMIQTCKSEPYKKAVVAKVKNLSCLFTGSNKDTKDGKENLTLDGDTLTLRLDQDRTASGVAVQTLKEALDK